VPCSFLLPLLLLSSCASDPTKGYSTRTTFREDITSIAVPIFENDTFDRSIPYELTDALIKEIEARTPYKVVSPARADTILLGRIRSVELNQISKSRLSGLSEEQILSVTIDFQWKDLRTDTVLVEQQSFAGSSLFVPSNPTGEPLELGQFGVAQSLARDVVARIRSSW
jgi:hypothetical protein